MCMALLAFGGRSWALTAEQVLGEYWKDPLFGAAASSQEVKLELLYKKIWPEHVTVQQGATVRIVALNRGEDIHILLFSDTLDPRSDDKAFQAFLNDERHHAANTVSTSHHQHSGGRAVDETVDIVKEVGQQPTLLIKPGEQKEMLLRFEDNGTYYGFCVVDEHWHQGYVVHIDVSALISEE